jgi:RNA polymerase primary sigma factor
VGIEQRQLAYKALLELAKEQGYVTFDDIMDAADRFSLPIQDFDWLSSSITTYGIIVYSEKPSSQKKVQNGDEDDDLDDFAQSDYEIIYRRIVELNSSLKPFVDYVRNVIPPQRKEIRKLKYQFSEGNLFARSRMIEMHLRLALRISLQRAEAYDMEIEDAIGYGCIGLIIAVDRYDPDTSGPFASYAALWIQNSIQRNGNPLWMDYYFPAHYKDKMFPILQKYEMYYRGEEIGTTMYFEHISAIANEFEMTESDVDKILRSVLSQKYGKESFEEIAELELSADVSIPSDVVDSDEAMLSEVMQEELRETVDKMLNALSEREADVIRMRNGIGYGSTMTLEEIGNKMNITRERVRQIEAKAIRKLSQASRKKILRDFL